MGKIPDSKREDDVIGGALKMIEGKWKLPVMYILCKNGSLRYNELKRRLDITSMMLTSTLKELEADGLVSRIQYNEVPPRVEYSATKEGRRLVPAMKEIRMWGENLMGKAAEVDQRGMPLDAADKERKNAASEPEGYWKYEYEDGTFAAGTIVKDPETGKEKELPLWELIKGTWWCFGADGTLKTGLIYDGDRQGWFYVDRKTGMKTGWVLVDGQWRYFEPMAHSVTGRMVAGTWIDGWYVDENGVWDGNERRVRSDEKAENQPQDEAIETEADIAKVISKARVSSNMTQKELADKSGINQSDISKLESGARNPSIAILKRLADGMGMNLNISFTPKGKS